MFLKISKITICQNLRTRIWEFGSRIILMIWKINSVSSRLLFNSLSWWCHQMETFFVLLAICAGNSLVTDEFPAQRPVTWSFDVFFDQRLNNWLSKQSCGWWFETPSCPLLHHCNEATWSSGEAIRIYVYTYKNGSILVHVMICCLMAPSYYLNLRWFIISEVLWQSGEGNFTKYGHDFNN